MTNNDDLALKLKAATENIGSETWHTEGSNVWSDEYVLDGEYCNDLIACCENVNNESVHADFIATASPANILSLLAERDWQTKRIEMLEKYVNERDEENQGLLLTVGRLHTKLEARTVSVNLPRYDLDMSGCDSCGQDCGADMSEEPDGDYVLLADVVAKLAAAGIKLEVEE